MSECLMLLAYLPWMRLHAGRVVRETLHRTRKAIGQRPNRHAASGGHGNAEWVLAE
jgi:hypothetical protein